jgi:cytochrome P450
MVAKLLALDKAMRATQTSRMPIQADAPVRDAPPVDALHASRHPDPYPWYAQLRASAPMAWDERLDLWIAADAAAVDAALTHPHLRVRPPAEPVPHALAGGPAGEVFAQLVRMTDGDFHAQHKPAVIAAAGRLSLDALRAAAAAAALDLRAQVDVNEWLTAVPVQAMARLLDVPAGERDATVLHVPRFTQGIAPGAGAEAVDSAHEAAAFLLAQARRAGLAGPAAANRIAFMQQALDATAGLIGNTVLALRRVPDAVAAWATPAARDDVAAEVARWDPPVHTTRRYAAQDLVLAGARIAAGEGVLVLLASANHDERANGTDAGRFMLRRAVRNNRAFGAGAHRCPGERLACAIVSAVLSALGGAQDVTAHFGRLHGYRPLANARIPVFN